MRKPGRAGLPEGGEDGPGPRFRPWSDIVLEKELPEAVRKSTAAYVGCVSGAVTREDYLEMIKKAGFRDLEVVSETPFFVEGMGNDLTDGALLAELKLPPEEINRLLRGVKSLGLRARKPG